MPGATQNQPRIRPLAQTTLPIMRETAQELRRLLGLHSTRNQELQRVLLKRPGGRDRCVPAPGAGRPGSCQRVTDAAHAVSLIGMDPFRRLLDALPEIEPGRHTGLAAPGGATARPLMRPSTPARIRTTRALAPTGRSRPPHCCRTPRCWPCGPSTGGRAALFTMRCAMACRRRSRCRRTGRAAGGRQSPARHRVGLPTTGAAGVRDDQAGNARPQTVKIADSLARTTSAGWQRETPCGDRAQLSEFLDVSATDLRLAAPAGDRGGTV